MVITLSGTQLPRLILIEAHLSARGSDRELLYREQQEDLVRFHPWGEELEQNVEIHYGTRDRTLRQEIVSQRGAVAELQNRCSF